MKVRTIAIAKSDVLFDVDAATHIFSKVNDGKDLRRFDALESDSEDAFNLSVLTRFMDRRVAELKGIVSRFLSTPNSAVSRSTSAMDPSETGYDFIFNVETAFQDELMDSLASDVESYIANGVIGDWYAASGDAMASSYLQTLPSISAKILETLVKRKFPTRS